MGDLQHPLIPVCPCLVGAAERMCWSVLLSLRRGHSSSHSAARGGPKMMWWPTCCSCDLVAPTSAILTTSFRLVVSTVPRAGRNEPLKKERPKWKSDYPMTDGQLRSKRDEFWDTAPAFEGRKEIWDALKAAAYAVEANDHSLAQAILDGASITLPHGSLTECYDELGNRYQLPVYCLAPPVNLILERGEEEAAEPAEPLPNARREFALKVRLSTGKDLRLSASMADTIGQLKKQLQAQEGIDLAWQRWFFSGKLLTDRTRLQETKIQKDFVVQVIVNQPLSPRN
ncbi:ubiquitin domain-containing protein 1 isoform X1 [Meleagris gallopavo]|uniref:ubiquitin domain-containing protein 1 isoform X1 n=2 Tax=Meleagris gallopavo TaxID=9103 RepID=UPI00093B39FD|nr:ubiquitin domain-containing protein 1 isoform X1 [Meleagris gallopavo]XP_019473279.1 ubiquitin domain-containing protein 1 isoform X1 [Meleagris gallopavo]